MTWWEWALLIIWGPGTLLAVVVTGALGVHLISDRRRPAPEGMTGDEALPQPRAPADPARVPLT